jgi:hypothetical protein
MTNGFEIPAEEDWPSCRGLFLQISRINHACEPNCAQRWVGGEKRVMMIVPVMDIEFGEKITVTYLPDREFQGVEERREWLVNEFGVWCECGLCLRQAAVKAEEVNGDLQEEDEAENGEVDAGREKPEWGSK